MSSEDYLLRQFQQLAKVLARLIGLRENRKHQQAIEEINQVLNGWFNLDTDRIDQLSEEELNNMVLQEITNDFEEAKAVAELIYQKAIIQNNIQVMRWATACNF